MEIRDIRDLGYSEGVVWYHGEQVRMEMETCVRASGEQMRERHAMTEKKISRERKKRGRWRENKQG